jgi:hypothetical protein
VRRQGFVIGIVVVLLLAAGCRERAAMEPLDAFQSADLSARVWSFQVYPGSEFLPAHTEAYRRTHLLLNPGAESSPPIAVYESRDSVEEVASFYGSKYGYGDDVASDSVAGFRAHAPPAYFTRGGLGEDTRNIEPILRQLGFDHDLSQIGGTWRGAHVSPTGPYPRVTIQRPWYDFSRGEVRDTTMILMVRE